MSNPAKILIIEDDRSTRRVLELHLGKDGYSVIAAQTGEEGLAMAETEKPSLVIIDIVLPNINGLEVLKALKAKETTRDIPAIVVSGVSEKEYREQAMAGGAAEFFIKADLHLEQFLESVSRLLKK